MSRIANGLAVKTIQILCLLAFLLADAFDGNPFASTASGATISNLTATLAWNPNSEPDLDSYVVHYGLRPGAYFRATPVGKATSATLSLPLASVTYYFALTARNSEGLESAFSKEVIYEAPAADIPIETFSARADCLEDQFVTLDFGLGDWDPSLEWTLTLPPSRGRLETRDLQVVYLPNADAWGTDGFEIVGNLGSPTPKKWVWEVLIHPEPDPPSAREFLVTTEFATPIDILLPGDDPDGDPVFFEMVEHPSRGTLLGIPPSLVYLPGAGQEGTDYFSYRVSDGAQLSEPATITIEILPASSPPLIPDVLLEVREDQFISFKLPIPDQEGLTLQVTENPRFGTLVGTPPNLTYRPVQDFFGNDFMELEAFDTSGKTNRAMVYFSVAPVNDIPIAEPLQVDTMENTSIELPLYGRDADRDELIYEVVTPPTKGTLSGEPPQVVYQPSLGEIGADSMTYRVSDGEVSSEPAMVRINIKPTSGAPTLQALLDPAGNVLLRWTSVPGRKYRVLQRSGLSPSAWLPASDVIVASSVTVRWNGNPQPHISAVFYAVEVLAE